MFSRFCRGADFFLRFFFFFFFLGGGGCFGVCEGVGGWRVVGGGVPVCKINVPNPSKEVFKQNVLCVRVNRIINNSKDNASIKNFI